MRERRGFMASRKRKKKIRSIIGAALYYVLLLAYSAVLILAVCIVLGDTTKYLKAYESSQPSSAIENFMSELTTGAWDSEIRSLAASKPHPFQSAEEVERIVSERVGNDLFYHRAGGNSQNGNVYNLYCGNYSVGSVTLKQDSSKAGSVDIGILSKLFDRSSLCPWYVDSSEIDITRFADTSSLEIVCPSTFTVMLNGTVLGQEYITGSGIHYAELDEYYADHAGLPVKTSYAVKDLLFGTVEPVFYDRKGEIVSVDPDSVVEDGNTRIYSIDSMDYDPPNEAEMAELRSFADSFITPYLNYFGTKNVDMNAGALRALIVPGCDIERRMKEFLDGAAWIHYYAVSINTYSFDNAFSLGDGFYVIDLSYDATAFSEYKTVQQPSNLRVVVSRTDAGLRAVSAE